MFLVNFERAKFTFAKNDKNSYKLKYYKSKITTELEV